MEGYQKVVTFFESSGLLEEELEIDVCLCVCTCLSIVTILYIVHVSLHTQVKVMLFHVKI